MDNIIKAIMGFHFAFITFTVHYTTVDILQTSHNTLEWCHNGRGGVSNNQPHDCLLNRLFRRRSKKTLAFVRVIHQSPVTGEFPAQRASNVENCSIWWCHYETPYNSPVRMSNMGCILWVQRVLYVLPQLLHCCIQYYVISDQVKTAFDCISVWYHS